MQISWMYVVCINPIPSSILMKYDIRWISNNKFPINGISYRCAIKILLNPMYKNPNRCNCIDELKNNYNYIGLWFRLMCRIFESEFWILVLRIHSNEWVFVSNSALWWIHFELRRIHKLCATFGKIMCTRHGIYALILAFADISAEMLWNWSNTMHLE